MSRLRSLAGVLAVRLRASDLGTALRHLGASADGHWLFTMDDFPLSDDPAFLETRHDPPEAYWAASERANRALETP